MVAHLLALLACTAPPREAATPDRPSADPLPDTGLGEDAGVGEDNNDTGLAEPDRPRSAVVTREVVEDHELDDSWLFSLDEIHSFELTLSDSAIASLTADPFTYVEGDVVIDGYEMPRIGVRLRGKLGSHRGLSGKPKFKLDFNHYIEDQRFFGHETLSLNNSVVDCGYIKEPVGYRVFEAAGVPAPRAGYATLTVNGTDYGLFVLIEVPDDTFLKRHWPDPKGNLYDGKYLWYGGYSYTMLDFASNVDSLFQLEEGTAVGNADISSVSAAITAHGGRSTFYDALGDVVDWPAIHRQQVAEQWVGHVDGYAMNTNNYRVYFDPADGKAELLPWDLDYGFIYDYSWGRSWNTPIGKLSYYCMTDARCRAERRDVAIDVLDEIDAIDPYAVAAEAVALIAETATADPRRECVEADMLAYQAWVSSWADNQSEALRTWWGIE